MDEPLADLALARRIERCEGKATAAFVDARARLAPETGATRIECAGAFALFDGAGSPITQTFCLGIFATPAATDLERIETFFAERGSGVFHEVSPLAGMETLDLLADRGYRPVEMTSVLYRSIPASFADAQSPVTTRIATPDEADLWSRTAAEGWSEHPESAAFMLDVGRMSIASEGMSAFFAELEGRTIGTGAVAIHDGVALLAGASTIPSARKQGAQRALLQARLRYASQHHCDLATMGAVPGSASQRNAERQGFRIAYTRTKWGRPAR
jgi:GNAT superfamily N-acetyltransferase